MLQRIVVILLVACLGIDPSYGLMTPHEGASSLRALSFTTEAITPQSAFTNPLLHFEAIRQQLSETVGKHLNRPPTENELKHLLQQINLRPIPKMNADTVLGIWKKGTFINRESAGQLARDLRALLGTPPSPPTPSSNHKYSLGGYQHYNQIRAWEGPALDEFIRLKIAPVLPRTGNVLELGAGQGTLIKRLYRWLADGVSYFEADENREALNVQRPIPTIKTQVHLPDLSQFPSNSFSGAVELSTLDCLSHHELVATLKELHRILKDGSSLVAIHDIGVNIEEEIRAAADYGLIPLVYASPITVLSGEQETRILYVNREKLTKVVAEEHNTAVKKALQRFLDDPGRSIAMWSLMDITVTNNIRDYFMVKNVLELENPLFPSGAPIEAFLKRLAIAAEEAGFRVTSASPHLVTQSTFIDRSLIPTTPPQDGGPMPRVDDNVAQIKPGLVTFRKDSKVPTGKFRIDFTVGLLEAHKKISVVNPALVPSKKNRAVSFQDNLENLNADGAHSFAKGFRQFFDDLHYDRMIPLMMQQESHQPLNPDSGDPIIRQRLLTAFRFFLLGQPLTRQELENLLTARWAPLVQEAIARGLFVVTKEGQIQTNDLALVPVQLVGGETVYAWVDLYLSGRRKTNGLRRIYIGADSFYLIERGGHIEGAEGVLVEPFSGSGIQLFSFIKLHTRVERGIGIEIDNRARNAARFSASMNGLGDKVIFIKDKTEIDAHLKGQAISVVLMNPPYILAPEKIDLSPRRQDVEKQFGRQSFAELTHAELEALNETVPVHSMATTPHLKIQDIFHKAGWGGPDGLLFFREFLDYLYPRLKNHAVLLTFGEFGGDESQPTHVLDVLDKYPHLYSALEALATPHTRDYLTRQLLEAIYVFLDLPQGDLMNKLTFRMTLAIELALKSLGVSHIYPGHIVSELHHFNPEQYALLGSIVNPLHKLLHGQPAELVRQTIYNILRMREAEIRETFYDIKVEQLGKLMLSIITKETMRIQPTIPSLPSRMRFARGDA